MRHDRKINSLGRTAQHRNLMLSNMACSLIKHKRITTTLAKAKTLRVYLEPIVTKAKVDNTNNRREAFAKLRDKEAVKELFHGVIEKVGDRQGGYLRILKTGFRAGDAATTAIIEFVDFNETYTASKAAKAETKKKTTRRSRSKKAADAAVAEEVTAPEATEAKEEPKAE